MTTELKEFARSAFDLFIVTAGTLVLIAAVAVFAVYLFGVTQAISEIGYRHALSLFTS